VSGRDVIAELFTSIRNGFMVNLSDVTVPFSKLKLSVVKILKDEGFIKYFEVNSLDDYRRVIKIGLKYAHDGSSVIRSIKRVSTPGRRIYVKKTDIPKVQRGFGICILSSSQGVVTGRVARLANTGGELIGLVY